MTLNGLVKIIYKFGVWAGRLMYLQVLWVLFTILGLGVFGVFPATFALASVVYNWFNKHTDISIYNYFKLNYKENFLQSNLLGLIISLTSVFLLIDIRISQQFIQSQVVHYLILVVSALFLIVVLNMLTIFSRYQLKLLQYFKQSFLIATSRPLESIAMIISLLIVLILYSYLPVLIFLMGASLILFPIVILGYRSCIKVEKKREKLMEETES